MRCSAREVSGRRAWTWRRNGRPVRGSSYEGAELVGQAARVCAAACARDRGGGRVVDGRGGVGGVAAMAVEVDRGSRVEGTGVAGGLAMGGESTGRFVAGGVARVVGRRDGCVVSGGA